MKKQYKNKFINIDKREYSKVEEALNRKQLSGESDVVKEYHDTIRSYFGAKYALSCSSGTAAIHLALLGLGIKQGDEVLVSSMGPVMTPLPILAIGAKPVFVDTDSKATFTLSVDDVKKKITSKTKAIITVPMWGYPTLPKDLFDYVRSRDIYIIEDVSHCHGAKYHNNEKFMGQLGDIGLFSTQERKLVSTGEGGIIITDRKDLYEKLSEIHNLGQPVREELKQYQGQFGILFGLNFRFNALGAALGIVQIGKLDEKIRIRTENAKRLKERLDFGWYDEWPIPKNTTPNYYSELFYVESPEAIDILKFGQYLFDNGIVSDPYRYNYKPLYHYPVFSEYSNNCPNAEYIAKSIFTLPMHEGLGDEDLDYIAGVVNNYQP